MPAPPPLIDALRDRYLLERELGRGGMATVWLARDLKHDRLVALKLLRPELGAVLGAERFLREIRLTANLQHPHILPLLDSGGAAGQFFYVTPYVEGESLRQRCQREGQFPLEDAVRLTGEVAEALGYAHQQGIIHRDIKPENILLSRGHALVADFGIALAVTQSGGGRLTETGLSLGTPAYMSPEQAMADPRLDGRSDQYSLACVLYEMLVGEPPFTGPTAQAIVARRLAEPARAIRPVRSSVPAGVEAAVLRALERAPADRFPETVAFADALRSPSAAGKVSRERSGKLVLRAVGGTLLFAAAALGAWLMGQRRGAEQDARAPEVVALYRRGVHEYDKRTPAGIADAVKAFTAAVQRDSTYAEAWAGLAKTYVRAYGRRFVFPGMARDSVLRLAVAAADRALGADRRSADAWVTQASVSRIVDPTDLTPVFRSLRQALALDSSNVLAWDLLALSLAESGDLDGALRGWRRSVSTDPSYTQGLAFLALAHYWRHQYDSAARWADSAIVLDPNYLFGRTAAAAIAIEREDFARGRAAFEAARRLSTDVEVVNALAGSALAEARAGASGEARGILQRAESLAVDYSPAPLHTAVYLASAYAGLGDADHAIAWLRQYRPLNDLHLQLHLRCDPPFASIETDPRFRSLLLVPRPARPGGC